jgi:hypothetical protein
MPPAILIIESHREVATALEEVVSCVRCLPVVTPHLEHLGDVGVSPAAILVRIAFEGVGEPVHAAIERLPKNRPPVVAIVRDERAAAEATRLKCDVVLRAPQDLGRLGETLTDVCGWRPSFMP